MTRTGAVGGGEPQPNRTSATTRQWIYRGLAVALVILFLMSVARFYHPGTGFTALIGFPHGHDSEAPAMRAVPHFDYPPWASGRGSWWAPAPVGSPQGDAAGAVIARFCTTYAASPSRSHLDSLHFVTSLGTLSSHLVTDQYGTVT